MALALLSLALTGSLAGRFDNLLPARGSVAAAPQVSLQAHVPSETDGIALGATVQETIQIQGHKIEGNGPELIDWYARLVGSMPAIVNVGGDWVHTPNFDPNQVDYILQRGAIPMWTWLPEDYSHGLYQPEYRLSAIAGGAFDAYLRQFAADAKAWGHPLLLRLAHEMNGNWYTWNTTTGNPNGNTPADYVAMWRHIHDIFSSVGATNVLWVWCANVASQGTPAFEPNYPGDAYVDWVALDGYNWGATSGNSWQSLYDVFGSSYNALTALTNRPIMIAETASVEQGGSKADWISQGLLQDLPARMPRIRALMWFEARMKGDWRVHTSQAALDAFRAVAASPLYKGQILVRRPVVTHVPIASGSHTFNRAGH